MYIQLLTLIYAKYVLHKPTSVSWKKNENKFSKFFNYVQW